MFEIELMTKNTMVFSSLSSRFPRIKFYRWCNSAVDYLEFYGKRPDLDELRKKLPGIARELGSGIVHEAVEKDRITAMLSCRCSIHNSAIRIVEANNCLLQPPVTYENGAETVDAVSFSEDDLKLLSSELAKVGDLEIRKKVKMDPESLHNVFLVPMSTLFGRLTDRQLTSLRDAIKRGYFSSPKQVSLEELAQSQLISESTMQEHLSKGLDKLLVSIESYLNLMIGYRSRSASQ